MSLFKPLIVCVIFTLATAAGQRNPFQFADEQLKKYTPIKIEKETASQQDMEQKWKITETKSDTTHILEDHEGNVRAISMGLKN